MGEFDAARKRILIDFDGVIHANDNSNWNGGKCDGPVVDGAINTIQRLSASGWECVVFTARDQRSIITQVEPWLKANKVFTGRYSDYHTKITGTGDIPRVTNIKEPAQFYIDDRAYRFTSWRDIEVLIN